MLYLLSAYLWLALKPPGIMVKTVLIGVIAGVVYAVIVYLIGWLGFKSISFSPEAIANFAVGGAVSGLGGVVGINRYTKKKRKR